jgi:hypothetical protein
MDAHVRVFCKIDRLHEWMVFLTPKDGAAPIFSQVPADKNGYSA